MKYLIADDDLVSRLALTNLVSGIPGASIEQAEDGPLVWDLLESLQTPAVCLLDIRMPGLSGIELLQKMRQAPRYTGWPVMLITGTADRGAIKDAAQFGVSGFLLKPVRQDSLARIGNLGRQFEHDILEPFTEVSARLRINHSRYQTYIHTFVGQLDLVVAELHAVDSASLAALVQRVEICRSAAVTLGSKHLVMLFTAILAALANVANVDASTVFDSYRDALLLIRNQIQEQSGFAV